MSGQERGFITNYEEYYDAHDPDSATLAEEFRDILPDAIYEEVKRKPLPKAKAIVLSMLLEVHSEHDDWDPLVLLDRGYYRDR